MAGKAPSFVQIGCFLTKNCANILYLQPPQLFRNFTWQHHNFFFFFGLKPIRLKKKKKFCVSKLPPAFVFLCAFDFAKFRLSFFFLEIIFFFHFYYKKRRKFAVLEEFKHVGAQKVCKILFDFWKYGSWNFAVIFGFGCAWRQRPIEVKKK